MPDNTIRIDIYKQTIFLHCWSIRAHAAVVMKRHGCCACLTITAIPIKGWIA